MIGQINTGYGFNAGWTTNTAGLLMNSTQYTSIKVHDANVRIAGFMFYDGPQNAITIGRDEGYGSLSKLLLNGNVGIGTTSPTQRLDVAGNIAATGGVTAASFTGNGAGLTGVNSTGLSCAGCIGNSQLAVNYAGSASKGGPATFALSAGLASLANDSLSLGGQLASNYARLDVANNFSGNQHVAGNLATTGTVAIGSGGTPIMKHLSLTFNPSLPALRPGVCSSANFTFAGASDGDTIALGVPNARMTGGGTLNYFAWVRAANTITIRVCNIDQNVRQTTAGSGAIRVDLWKH